MKNWRHISIVFFCKRSVKQPWEKHGRREESSEAAGVLHHCPLHHQWVIWGRGQGRRLRKYTTLHDLGNIGQFNIYHRFSQPIKKDEGDFNCASECGLYSAKDKVI